jgi:hypothetical protein
MEAIMDNMNSNSNSSDAMDELNALFGREDEAQQKAEKIVLSQNLEGFASCFPDWDLHPPVDF